MSWHLAMALGVVMISALAADGDQRGTRESAKAEVGHPFTLAPGGRARITDETLEIGFTRVVSDSRCPKGAECIVAGEAALAIWVSLAGERSDHELHTDPPAKAALAQGPYTITLEKLEPSTDVRRPIAPGSYLATFVVRRNER